MGTFIIAHNGLSNTVWIFFLILGLWGAFRALRGQGVDGSYLGAVAIGQLLFVVQAILGGILWFGIGTATLDRPWLHLLYGLFALVFIPFIYLVALSGEDDNRAQWVLSFSTFFMFGIALRLISAGGA